MKKQNKTKQKNKKQTNKQITLSMPVAAQDTWSKPGLIYI